MRKEIVELRKEMNMVSNRDFSNLFLGAGYIAINDFNDDKNDCLNQAMRLLSGMRKEDSDYLLASIRDLELTNEELVEEYYALLDRHYSFVSTKALDEIIYKIVKLKDNSKVLDYCCGYGSFLKNMITLADNDKKKINALGIELNYTQAIVTDLVMDLLGVDAEIANRNALEIEACDYDLAFTIPPIRSDYVPMNVVYKNMELFNSRTSSEWVFIYKLLEKLNDNNKIIAILPDKPLHSIGDHNFRKYLRENQLVEAIVALPAGLITGVAINMNLVIFSKNNKLVKVKNFTNKFDRAAINKEDFVNKFLDLYYEDGGIVYYRDCIYRNELVPEALLGEKIHLIHPKLLREICDIRIGSQYTISHFKEMITEDKTGWYLLTPGDINDGEIDYNHLNRFNPRNEDGKLIKHVIKENDIIITSKSSTLKIAIAKQDMGNVVVTGGMYILTPNTTKVEPLFLKLFLESDKGQECLDRIKKGTVIKSIDKNSLEEMKVECPKLEIQKEKASEYRTMQIDYEEAKARLEYLKLKLNNLKNSLSR